MSGKKFLDMERRETLDDFINFKIDHNNCITSSRNEWNRHISTMTNERIPQVVRDKSPKGHKHFGRPR